MCWQPIGKKNIFCHTQGRKTIRRLCDEYDSQQHYVPSHTGWNDLLLWLWLQKRNLWIDSGLMCKRLQEVLRHAPPATTPMCPSGSDCRNGSIQHRETVRHVGGTGPFGSYLPPSPDIVMGTHNEFVAYCSVCLFFFNDTIQSYQVFLHNQTRHMHCKRYLPGLDNNISDTALRSLPEQLRPYFDVQAQYIDIPWPNFKYKNTRGYALRIYLQHLTRNVIDTYLTHCAPVDILHECVFTRFLIYCVLPALQGILRIATTASVSHHTNRNYLLVSQLEHLVQHNQNTAIAHKATTLFRF